MVVEMSSTTSLAPATIVSPSLPFNMVVRSNSGSSKKQNTGHQSGRGPMKKEDATVQVISTEPVSTVSTAAENKENSITTQQLGQENPKASSTESSTNASPKNDPSTEVEKADKTNNNHKKCQVAATAAVPTSYSPTQNRLQPASTTAESQNPQPAASASPRRSTPLPLLPIMTSSTSLLTSPQAVASSVVTSRGALVTSSSTSSPGGSRTAGQNRIPVSHIAATSIQHAPTSQQPVSAALLPLLQNIPPPNFNPHQNPHSTLRSTVKYRAHSGSSGPPSESGITLTATNYSQPPRDGLISMPSHLGTSAPSAYAPIHSGALFAPGPFSFLASPTQAGQMGLNGPMHGHDEGQILQLSMPPLRRPDHKVRLEAVLQQHGAYETDKGMELRREVIKELNVLVQQWTQSLSLGMRMQWQDNEKVCGRIVTFGSYFLGISHQGADIDALCITPQHITREDYFHSFYKLLESRPEVSDLRGLEDAFVPVIKMRYNGIEIDLTFARMNVATVPPAPVLQSSSSSSGSVPHSTTSSTCGDVGMSESNPTVINSSVNKEMTDDSGELADFLISDKDLLLLDDPKCIRSLNGYRSTLKIKTLVPNQEVFKLALRAVKQWAKSQGIYSNIVGYLGGFSWAVLVAKACRMHPQASAVEVIQKFFHLYAQWQWPAPVTLVDLPANPATPGGNPGENFPAGPDRDGSWVPGLPFQYMPIITPTFPHLNSSFNVSSNTMKLIQQKMLVAAGTCDKIVEGKDSWDSLFKTCHMFHEYEHFLVVIASSSEPLKWFGLIESRIRHLVTTIERECVSIVQSARIWPQPATGPSGPQDTKQLWFIGLDLWKPIDQFNLKAVQRDLENSVCKFAEYVTKAGVRQQGLGGGGVMGGGAGSSFYRLPQMAQQLGMSLNGTFVLKSQLNSVLGEKTVQDIVSQQTYIAHRMSLAQRTATANPYKQPHLQPQQSQLTPPTTPTHLTASSHHLIQQHHQHQQQLRSIHHNHHQGGLHSGVYLHQMAAGGTANIIQQHHHLPFINSYASVAKSDSGGSNLNLKKIPPSNSVVTSPSATSTAVASSVPMTSYAQATSQATLSKANSYYAPPGPDPPSPGEVSPLPSMGPGAVRTSPSGGLMERTWNTNNRSPQPSSNLILDHQPPMPNRNSRSSDKTTGRPTNRNAGHAKSPRMGSKCETSQTTDFKSAGNDILSLIGGNGDTISNSNAEIKQKSSFKSLVPPPPPRVSCGSGSSTGGSLSSAAGLTEDLGNVSMESDHARSVSFSSDKFPPSPLVLARIQHGEKTLPFSPGGFPLPPPTTHHLPPSAADPTFKSTPTKTNPRQTNKAGKRRSIGEIADVPTPTPIQTIQFQRLRFNFNPNSLAAAAAAHAAATAVATEANTANNNDNVFIN